MAVFLKDMEFTAEVAHLRSMLGFIVEQAKTAGIEGRTLGNIELASEEAIVNIVHHAYPKKISPKSKTLNITCEFSEPGRFVVMIRDAGVPFDPHKKSENLQLDVPIEERKVGGLGLYMIKQLVSELQYERINDENLLSLIFLL